MKVEIPDELKAGLPQTMWGRIFAATPVVMTVLATMLAGLASSEMTRAQYDRSLAAQQQSKAGDQWSFFQAKRLRGELQDTTLDLIRGTGDAPVFEPASFKQSLAAAPTVDPRAAQAKSELLALLDANENRQALESLKQGVAPKSAVTTFAVQGNIQAAVEAISDLRPEPEIAAILVPVETSTLDDLVRTGREASADLDKATRQVNSVISRMEVLLDLAAPGIGVTRAFTVARLKYAASRYEAEARLNQSIANIYELQVRKSNTSAARHHARSQRFFFGMLAAQAAVIIATFAMAARNRNLLWSMAAAAGLAAVALSIYVYVYV